MARDRASLTWKRNDAGVPATALKSPDPVALLELAWGRAAGVTVTEKGDPVIGAPAAEVINTFHTPERYKVKGMGYRPAPVSGERASRAEGEVSMAEDESVRVLEDSLLAAQEASKEGAVKVMVYTLT